MPPTVRPSGISVNIRGNASVEGSVKLRRRRTGELPQRGVVPPATAGGGRRRSTGAVAPLTEAEALIRW